MEKKSLINTLKSTKKVNVVTVPAKNDGGTSRKVTMKKAVMKKVVY
jgi:broad specificity polyphosphatase/5'/3'-nucleotidase SurE